LARWPSIHAIALQGKIVGFVFSQAPGELVLLRWKIFLAGCWRVQYIAVSNCRFFPLKRLAANKTVFVESCFSFRPPALAVTNCWHILIRFAHLRASTCLDRASSLPELRQSQTNGFSPAPEFDVWGASALVSFSSLSDS
jgi:hypothetical protein